MTAYILTRTQAFLILLLLIVGMFGVIFMPDMAFTFIFSSILLLLFELVNPHECKKRVRS